ncbi:hypothetical protein DXG01_000080 [Tephrocybe rancida]|nr:hypothetical protein DXG01_000080 [Tephrocybe rancida]
MPQQSPSPANVILSSSPDPTFVPRKEFKREQKATPSSFAIVAISSSSFVRLYSFPAPVITALRALFESSLSLAAFREDVPQHLCEFTLHGKPWASPKNVVTEKLLIDILAVIYQCGYTYLSSLDYGRESDDRLAMAFSRPSTYVAGSRSATPLSGHTSPFRDSSTSVTSDRHKPRRTPFALSFLSPTLMRVIAPPLHLTPAILQAVRASWPRGVVSEKKVGDNSFEFKLKGYRWFQQDTFATDSLRHILSLLTSLDSHAFTLLSSISLTNRSRVKDLWVFTGPGSDSGEDGVLQDPFAGIDANGDTNRAHISETGQVISTPANPFQHRRLASEPTSSSTHMSPPHIRAATEQGNVQHFTLTHGYRAEHPSMGPALLRKPAPRAQVPVSAVHEIDPPGAERLRANLPSVISSGVEDMTGVGASGYPPDAFYPSSSFQRPNIHEAPATPAPVTSSSPNRPRSPLRPVANRQKTPPLLMSNGAHSPVIPAHTGQGLLGAGAFRDSSVSNASDTSFDIPIHWTGIGDAVAQRKEPYKPADQGAGVGSASRRRVSSVGPMLPGGWQPTPIEEKPEGKGGIVGEPPESPTLQDKNAGNKTPIHEVSQRVASPELTRPDMPLRKSEAALVGLITDTQRPPLPATSRGGGADSPSSGNGQGWVLVNVGESSNGSQVAVSEQMDGTKAEASGSSEHPTPGPHAKAIVIIDALDNKKKGKEKADATSPFKKRLFSLGRNNSGKAVSSDASQQIRNDLSPPTRPAFRDRFRFMGTPEAPRKEGKRRSIH